MGCANGTCGQAHHRDFAGRVLIQGLMWAWWGVPVPESQRRRLAAVAARNAMLTRRRTTKEPT